MKGYAHKALRVHNVHKTSSFTKQNKHSMALNSEPSNSSIVSNIISMVETNKKIQGHICINNTDLFDTSVSNGIYGFPGDKDTTATNIKITAWRAIASLFNIGPDDLIILYRTAPNPSRYKRSAVPGAQEFHGIFQVRMRNEAPFLFLHFDDSTYLQARVGKKNKLQTLPFRFLFNWLTKNPISIPNDLRNQKYHKNNNLEIIKALSETDPRKPRLWGFRHPAVMNIGAARKSSIVAISNAQLRFFLKLMQEKGVERPIKQPVQTTPKYDVEKLPAACTVLDDEYLSKHFAENLKRGQTEVEFEAELYAYFTAALKNPKSVFHKKIIEELKQINPSLSIESIAENVILEMLPTLHIQEEVDILLCDSAEKNFLIFEMKNGTIRQEDLEQAEKYIQLVNQRFPDADGVSANIVGSRNPNLESTEHVKLISYKIEKEKEHVGITLKLNTRN